MIIENLNNLLESNDIMCRIGSTWYKLESINVNDGKMPIMVSDDDGGEHEFDMADIDEFDPIFGMFKGMDRNIVGEASARF